jgi:hypothetical protein
VSPVTLSGSAGTPAAVSEDVHYRCRFCHQEVAFENGRYPYIHTMVLLHLSACEEATMRLQRGEIDAESFTIADRLIDHPTDVPVDQPADRSNRLQRQ